MKKPFTNYTELKKLGRKKSVWVFIRKGFLKKSGLENNDWWKILKGKVVLTQEGCCMELNLLGSREK